MTIKRKITAGLAAGLALSGAAHAQPIPPMVPIDDLPVSQRLSIPLSNVSAEGEQWEYMWAQVMVRNTVSPSLYPVRPRAGKSNGKAVIIVPGGGYRLVSIESEGFKVADKLAAAGYTAFVLKYRVTPTPRDKAAYWQDLMSVFAGLGDSPLPDYQPAEDDMAAAITYVRDNAAEYAIRPDAIGAIGFSAGARTAIRILETSPTGAHVSHVALIYPPMDKSVEDGPRPPLFMAIAVDDPLFKQGKFNMVNDWLAQSENVEFHLYAGGAHGFGMHVKGTTSDLWIDQYIAWLNWH